MKEELTGNEYKGQSTLEILIALAILTLGASAAIVVVFGGQSLTVDTRESNQAVSLARQNLEQVEAAAKNNFNGITNSSTTQNEFLEEIVVQSVTTSTKTIISRVSWHTDPLRTQKIELTTTVTNWSLIQQTGGDTGGSGLTGNWQNPKTLGSINLGPGESATGIEVLNGIVYLSAVASDIKKPDFFVVNATNGQSPFTVASLDTGPGLNAVEATTQYAYVANSDPNAQLQIINIANLSNPILVASFRLPGVSGSGAVGQAVFYLNSKVYVGTGKANGPEFHIVDVSNPSNPVELGSFDVNTDVNSIYVSGTTAYLATSDDSGEMKILDVSNPKNVQQIGQFDAPGPEAGKSVYLVGSTLYLGRLSGKGDPEFYILDVGNPVAVKVLGSARIGGDVNGVNVRDYLAFLATTLSNNEFEAWNISNPASTTLWSSYNFPEVATGIDYESNLVYVSVRSNDALRIITSQ